MAESLCEQFRRYECSGGCRFAKTISNVYDSAYSSGLVAKRHSRQLLMEFTIPPFSNFRPVWDSDPAMNRGGMAVLAFFCGACAMGSRRYVILH
eukprot:4031133-Amphidinium_carterae.1